MNVDPHSPEATEPCELCRCVRCGARNPDLLSGFIDTHKAICSRCASQLALVGYTVPMIFEYIDGAPKWTDA